jgi:phage shock protein PspC (stress-responsive transcriptional regulator)
MANKKLYRSNDRVFGGVCAGLAEYFDFDVTAVRAAYALLTFFTAFSGIPCYFILWLIMPAKDKII